MRKFSGMSLGATLALALAAQAALAQDRPVTTHKERPETVKINVSGQIQLDYVWRSAELTAVVGSFSSGSARPSSENTVEGQVALRFDIELTDKISAVLEIGTESVDDNATNVFGQALAESVVLREMHVNVAEFLNPAVKAQLGIATWSFDIRGKGSSFAFDPRHSQSISRNWRLTADSLASFHGRMDDPEELDPAGAVFTYAKESLQIDIVILPAVLEGGNPSDDEALYAVDLFFKISEKSRLGVILAGSNMTSGAGDGSKTGMVTFGAGASLGLAEGLEIYGEIYFQFGRAGEILTAGGEETARARGRAGQLGFQYNVAGANNIWFGANATYVSGDDDELADDDDSVDTFLGYENVNDLIIVEDQYFGMDVDANYIAFKLMGGLSFSVGGGTNNIELAAKFGIVRTAQDIAVGTEDEDQIGNEFDLQVKYHVNRQLSVVVNFGVLVSADLLEEQLRAQGGEDEAEDNCTLASLGFDLKF